METLPTQNSAFRIVKSHPEPQDMPIHHNQLWKVINSGLKTGRTYNYAACCATLYDNRKKNNSEKAENNHSKTSSMVKSLGKRTFNSLEDFSKIISQTEKTLETPIDTIALNRNHIETQNAIKINHLERRITNLEQDYRSTKSSLESRITYLEKELIENEHRINAMKAIAQRANAAKDDQFCPKCKINITADIEEEINNC